MRDGRLKYWLGALVWEYRKRTELAEVWLLIPCLIAIPMAGTVLGVVVLAFALLILGLRGAAGLAECEMYRRTKWYPVDFRDVRKMATARPSSTDSAPGL